MRNSQYKQFTVRTFAPILKSGKFEIGNIEYQFSSAFSAKTKDLWINRSTGSMDREVCWFKIFEILTETPIDEDERTSVYVDFLLTVSSILMHMQQPVR